MKFKRLIPELKVSNLEASKALYLDGLGFRIRYERPEDKFAFIELDGSQIMLYESLSGSWNTGGLVYPFGRGINLQMIVNDVDKLYERVKKKNLVLFQEMSREKYSEWLVEEFLVQDPDGYLLRFQQEVKSK